MGKPVRKRVFRDQGEVGGGDTVIVGRRLGPKNGQNSTLLQVVIVKALVRIFFASVQFQVLGRSSSQDSWISFRSHFGSSSVASVHLARAILNRGHL